VLLPSRASWPCTRASKQDMIGHQVRGTHVKIPREGHIEKVYERVHRLQHDDGGDVRFDVSSFVAMNKDQMEKKTKHKGGAGHARGRESGNVT